MVPWSIPITPLIAPVTAAGVPAGRDSCELFA
jgi:hypothetical protein